MRSMWQPGLFKGKTVFVTGGGSGINLAIARQFAALGARIGMCGRSQDKLHAAAQALRETGVAVHAQVADVRDYQALASALEATRDTLGSIDVLVCGAAGNFVCAAQDLSANGFRTVVEIDLLGSFHAARAAFEQLRETRGCVIFVSAGQAFTPFENQVHVGAAKAGIDNMMKNLALEWGRHGIRSNSVVPGFIADTEGTRRMADPQVVQALQTSTPLGRLGQADEVAQMAVFLASPMAAYVTGHVAVVDGGHYLGGSSLYSAVSGDRATLTSASLAVS